MEKRKGTSYLGTVDKIKRSRAKRITHILRRNCLLKHAIERSDGKKRKNT
jgi:hypothetical protein